MTAGLYLHIPYCRKKCNYCDFYSKGGYTAVPEEYIDRLIARGKSYPGITFKTVYFGGGTPSLLTPRQVEKLLSAFSICLGAEITLEANPDTMTLENLSGFRRRGVNRLSVGVQTVRDASLKNLGRIHTARQAGQALSLARRAGFENISGDIMLGLDNYTFSEMRDTVDFLAGRGVKHISAYMLKIEEGTPFYENPPAHLPSDEETADFYLAACRYLEEKGYHQYEISNFAKEGYHSRHNSIYWQLGDYLGLGPGAHSCLGGKRFYYPRDLRGFLSSPLTVPDGEVDGDDFIMLSLRLAQGLDLKKLEEKWGVKIPPQGQAMLERLKKEGFIRRQGDTISLTPKGYLIENSIASEIMKYN